MWESMDSNNKQKLRDYYVSVNKYDHRVLGVNCLPDLVRSEALGINKYFKREDPDDGKAKEFNMEDLSALEEESATSEEVTDQEFFDSDKDKPKVKWPKENPYLVKVSDSIKKSTYHPYHKTSNEIINEAQKKLDQDLFRTLE